MPKIAIVGVGNCASSLVQAIDAIKQGVFVHEGLISNTALVDPKEIEVVAAFDVSESKVGFPLTTAIFASPNCTTKYFDPNSSSVIVEPGPLLDGIDGPLRDIVVPSAACSKSDIEQTTNVLRKAHAELLILYLPVGAEKAADYYTQAALNARCGVVNNTPACIANSEKWRALFAEAKLPLLGDDMKSHIGSTTVHQTILQMLKQRNISVTSTYQLNVGGNADFLNMREPNRAVAKRATKNASLATHLEFKSNSGVGPSDYIEHLADHKVGYITIEGQGYMGMPLSIDVKLTVEDSPNAAAVGIEGIRLARAIGNQEKIDLELAGYELYKYPSVVPLTGSN